MNRGQGPDLVYMNTPISIGNVPSTFDIYARPNPATLAPLFTPQVPIVPMQPQVSPFINPPAVPYGTIAPKSGSAMESTTYKVSLITLAIILVLWIVRLLFKRK